MEILHVVKEFATKINVQARQARVVHGLRVYVPGLFLLPQLTLLLVEAE